MDNTLDTLVIINESLTSLVNKVDELSQPTNADCILAAIICCGLLLLCLLFVVAASKARAANQSHDKEMKMLEYKQAEKKIFLDFCYNLAKNKDESLSEARKHCCDFLKRYEEQFNSVNKTDE